MSMVAQFFTCRINYDYGLAVRGDLSNYVGLDSWINGGFRINLAGTGGAGVGYPRANMCSGVSYSQRYVLNYTPSLRTYSTWADVTVTV
jgi:hypothetical protein